MPMPLLVSLVAVVPVPDRKSHATAQPAVHAKRTSVQTQPRCASDSGCFEPTALGLQ